MDFELLNAVSILESPHGIVAIPGPEGYSLVARLDRPDTLGRIARITGNNADMLLLGRDINAFTPYVATIPERAFDLMSRYWPGLLIVKLTKTAFLPQYISAGPMAMLMQPEAPLLLDLLSLVPGGILAASLTGRVGDPLPQTGQAVFDMFGDDVDFVLEQDETILQSGLATIVSIDQDGAVHLLRSGRIVLD